MANKEAKQIKRFVENTSKELAEDVYGNKVVIIPKVANLDVTNGTATWEKPDITDIEMYEPEISYLIYVNDEFIEETIGKRFNSLYYSEVGNNNLKIITKAILHDNSKPTTIKYSTNYELKKLDVYLGSIANMASCKVDNYIYLFGGRINGNQYCDTILKYDTLTDTYTTLPEILPMGLLGMQAVKVDNYIYLFGGEGLNYTKTEIYRFDILTETIDTTSLTAKTTYHLYAALGYYNGDIYIVGGDSTDYYYKGIQKYDIASDTITTLRYTFPDSTYGFGYAVIGKDIWIFGGSTRKSPYATNITRKFDMELEVMNIYNDVTPPIYPYYSFQDCAVINGKIYLFGGSYRDYGWNSDKILEFDPDTKTFRFLNVKFDVGGYLRAVETFGNTAYLIGVWYRPLSGAAQCKGYVYKFKIEEE